MSFTDPGFETMSLDELKEWLGSNDLSAASYSELLNQLTVDLPTALPGVVQSSIGGSSGSVTPPAQGSTLEWDSSQQLYVPSTSSWTPYTPVVTSNAGALTSANVSGSYLSVSNGLTAFQFTVDLVNIGTANSDMFISLPMNFTSSGFASCIAREIAVTGALAFCYIQGVGAHLDIYSTFLTSSSTIWVNGYSWSGHILVPGTFS